MRKVIGVLFAGVLLMAASLAGTAAVNDYAWFMIDDSDPSAALLSDTRGEYADYRLPEGDKCVNAWAASTGLFFAYLYRGSNLGDSCYAVYPDGVRTYTLLFPEGSAPCVEFGACTLEVASPGESPGSAPRSSSARAPSPPRWRSCSTGAPRTRCARTKASTSPSTARPAP